VEQTSPRPGIHIFTNLPEANAVDYRLGALLAPLSSLSGATPTDIADLSVSADVMAQFMEQCNSGENSVSYNTLIQAGWPENAAKQFTHDCNTFPIWVGVAVWNLRNAEPETLNPVMVFQGDGYCWMTENQENDQERLRLRLVDGAQCAAKLMALAEPLKKTYLSD
jgi:hypothetical protein